MISIPWLRIVENKTIVFDLCIRDECRERSTVGEIWSNPMRWGSDRCRRPTPIDIRSIFDRMESVYSLWSQTEFDKTFFLFSPSTSAIQREKKKSCHKLRRLRWGRLSKFVRVKFAVSFQSHPNSFVPLSSQTHTLI